MRDRLAAKPSQRFIEYVLAPKLFEDLDKNFEVLMHVNLAHVVMLVHQHIIRRDTGREILRSLQALLNDGARSLALDPAREDLYFNIEAALIERLGRDIAGQMHTGRSRNDLYATTQRMKIRERLCPVIDLALDLRAHMLDVAARHGDTVLTGYTHQQPAQPITVGHYLSAIADALCRDTRRLLRVYPDLNRSPLGAGALAATGFPIDRALTAQLLGFQGLVENSLDAVASRDYVPEILAGFAILAITLGRMSQDLYLWCSYEFGYVDIADEAAITSSIMPQKKNPVPLEHVKAKGGHIIGALAACLAILKGTTFSHSRDVNSESPSMFNEAAQQLEAIIGLTDAVLGGLVFHEERMLGNAWENFCTVTELTDVLVREFGMSFGVAHQVVGTLVREAIQQGIKSARGLTPEMCNAALRRVGYAGPAISDAAFRAALDPVKNVHTKTVLGGPAPTEVARMVERARAELENDRALVSERRRSLEEAEAQLHAAVKVIVSG
jgi:argininosuccinate lyase